MAQSKNTTSSRVKVGAGSRKQVTKKSPSFLGKLNKWTVIAFVIVVFGGLGSYFLYASHADSLSTLYRFRKGTSHMYTASASEEASLKNGGWTLEGQYNFVNEAGSVPVPVYRLYRGGDHLFTTSSTESSTLKAAGWGYEGVAFQSASSVTVPYGYCRQNWTRLYKSGAGHFFTASAGEVNTSVAAGWHVESSKAFSLDYFCSTNPAPVPPTLASNLVGAVVSQGSNISVPVQLKLGGVPVDTLEIHASYPTGSLKYVGVDRTGSVFNGASLGNSITNNGKIVFTVSQTTSNPPISGTEQVVYFNFTALASSGTATIDFSGSKAAYAGTSVDLIGKTVSIGFAKGK
jgi:hypothetical protein